MITKRILVPGRLRRPPATGWSWMDGRFVREHMDHLSREAVLLYFFLAAVADVNGLSFYSDGTVAARLRMPLPSLFQARDELLAYDLIAHEPPLTQVLSLPLRCQRRRSFGQLCLALFRRESFTEYDLRLGRDALHLGVHHFPAPRHGCAFS